MVCVDKLKKSHNAIFETVSGFDIFIYFFADERGNSKLIS